MNLTLLLYSHIKDKFETSPYVPLYHNWKHTKNVFEVVFYLSKLEGLNKEYTELLKKAALYHDTGYLSKPDMDAKRPHELTSISIAEAELILFGFPHSDIQNISRLIQATMYETHATYVPTEIGEQIMHDADFSYLGMDYYPFVTELLRNELGVKYSDWITIEIDFLKNFRFYTKPAQKLFNEQKQINLNNLMAIGEL